MAIGKLTVWVWLGAAVWAAGPETAGLKNFAQVDTHIYRGGQPTEEGLKYLAKMGVKTVIDLRGAEQTPEKQQVESMGMKYVHFPLPPLSAPSDEAVAKILKLLSDPGGSSDWPVYVHCMRGKDRTGVVVACYRIKQQGWDNRKALLEARQRGLSRLERGMLQYILTYKPDVAAQAATAGVPVGR